MYKTSPLGQEFPRGDTPLFGKYIQKKSCNSTNFCVQKQCEKKLKIFEKKY